MQNPAVTPLALDMLFGSVRKCSNADYLPGNTWISVDPPGPSNTCLSLKYAELIEPKLLFQLTGHSNARGSSANNEYWIVCVSIVLIAVYAADGF